MAPEMTPEDLKNREELEKGWEAYDQKRAAFMKEMRWDERQMVKHETRTAEDPEDRLNRVFRIIFWGIIIAFWMRGFKPYGVFLLLIFLLFPISHCLTWIFTRLEKLWKEDIPEFTSTRPREEGHDIRKARESVEKSTAVIRWAYDDLARYVSPHWIGIARWNLRVGTNQEAEGLKHLATLERQADEWYEVTRARRLPEWPRGAWLAKREQKEKLSCRENWYKNHRERVALNERKALWLEEKKAKPAAPTPAAAPTTDLTLSPVAVEASIPKPKKPGPIIQPHAVGEPVPVQVSAESVTEPPPVVQAPPADLTPASVLEPPFVEPTPKSPPAVAAKPPELVFPSRPPSGDLSADVKRAAIIFQPPTAKPEPVKVEAIKAEPEKRELVEAPIETPVTAIPELELSDVIDLDRPETEREKPKRPPRVRGPRKESDENFDPMPRVEGRRKLRTNYATVRDPKLRAAAIQIHGRNCCVCNFNFDAVFGEELARGYIEVHHLDQISTGERTTDPTTDLAPLCANCHAMADRLKTPPSTIQGLRAALLPSSIIGEIDLLNS